MEKQGRGVVLGVIWDEYAVRGTVLTTTQEHATLPCQHLLHDHNRLQALEDLGPVEVGMATPHQQGPGLQF